MTNEIKIEFPYQIPSKEVFDKLPFNKSGCYTETQENGDVIIHYKEGFIEQYIKKEGYKKWYKEYTYQYITRDSQGGAIKATFAIVDGVHRNLFKEPKTDLSKKSACGLIRVDKDENGDYFATDKQTWESFQEGELVKIYENMFIKDKFVTVQEIKDTLTIYRNKEMHEFYS
jgi:hypothetical protein